MSPSTPETVHPLSAVRLLALYAQGLHLPLGAEQQATLENVYQVVAKLGCVQIDTLQMVQRSQYLVLWSRLGAYDPALLDRLAYDPAERRLFEYWKHAAALIPLDEFRYHLPTMRWFREGKNAWNQEWLDLPGNRQLAEQVLSRVRLEGGLAASDFERDGNRRGSWWSWKPAKEALEHLYNTGDLMISRRVNFQRVYNLRERVLPDWVDGGEVSMDERNRFRVEQALRCLGVSEPAQVAEYAYLKRGVARPHVEALLKAGVIVPLKARLVDGQVHELVMHRDLLPDLERLADGALAPRRTTLLSPFDSLFWAAGRDEQLWGFEQILEAYKPAAQRRWGYFCLPILHGERLVGRLDPKLERQKRMLRLKALYLEEGVELEESLLAGLAAALRDFLAFHGATDLEIERSQPQALGRKLQDYL